MIKAMCNVCGVLFDSTRGLSIHQGKTACGHVDAARATRCVCGYMIAKERMTLHLHAFRRNHPTSRTTTSGLSARPNSTNLPPIDLPEPKRARTSETPLRSVADGVENHRELINHYDNTEAAYNDNSTTGSDTDADRCEPQGRKASKLQLIAQELIEEHNAGASSSAESDIHTHEHLHGAHSEADYIMSDCNSRLDDYGSG